ncbi:MAG: FkbM family methyltransferase [Candidatus Sericytochromatia bacterium]|nr:FkbM family methyltransferase [Candidatus Sericytochromatia bacterium]
MGLDAWLHRLRYALAGSPAATRLALAVRNQCALVVGLAVTRRCGHTNLTRNGEGLLASAAAPRVRTFIDVGANVGEWTAHLLGAAGRPLQGVLVEPGAEAAARLRARFADQPGLTVVEAAASDEAHPAVTFHEEPGAGETSSLVAGASRADSLARQVEAVTLDALVAAQGWPAVDLLKIDTEGHDLRVLQGARQLLAEGRLGLIQLEYNAAWRACDSSVLEARHLLGRHGYALWLLTPAGLTPLELDRLGDFFSYANLVAVSPTWQAQVGASLPLVPMPGRVATGLTSGA